jgi:hypothetical protein
MVLHHTVALVQVIATAPPLISGTVRGAESGQPLAFSIVSLLPKGLRQFTDGAGAFAFDATTPGTYILSVRQIGYAPLDTQIVVGETATVLHVALRRLAIELPPVTVTAARCIHPGRPDSSDAALRAVFDQLQENARRFELLADSYPFDYVLELARREIHQRGDTGRPIVRRIRFSSSDDHPYAVGSVVEPAWGPWGNTGKVIRTADLRDLGNPSFIANHCFHLAGYDTIAGQILLRIDFEPASRIWSPDMAGAAYLDSATYELRYTETSLTRPDRAELEDTHAIHVRTRFHDIAAGVPLQDSLTAVTVHRDQRRASIETQRTVEVRFRHKHP